MTRLILRYLGHRPGASLSYFTGASVDLVSGAEVEIPAEGLIVGRSAGAGLRVASSAVARSHARIWPVPEGLAVEDLGSTNGTFVNESGVRTAVLRAGDRLTFAASFDFAVVERAG